MTTQYFRNILLATVHTFCQSLLGKAQLVHLFEHFDGKEKSGLSDPLSEIRELPFLNRPVHDSGHSNLRLQTPRGCTCRLPSLQKRLEKEKLEETPQSFLPILYSCFFISASTTYMSPSASTKTLRGRTSQTTYVPLEYRPSSFSFVKPIADI